jgi:DNA-binding MarR family transcriptional regulator
MTETGEAPWWADVAFPALLRGARAAYTKSISAAMEAAGFDDVPRNGAYVIAAIARTGAPLAEIIRALGVSKQAAGQLVDTLVMRGYLDRSVDPADRRRLTITLTDRGRATAAVIRSAVEAVDADVLARVGPESVARARAVLAALAESAAGRDPEHHHPHAHPAPDEETRLNGA